MNELRELTKIAKSESQTAYSNFTHSLKQKWNFAMRAIPGLENYLLPLEDVISKEFLPYLLGCPIKPEIRELISLPPRLGGMGIINPIKAAVEEFKNSVCLTKQLTKKVIEQDKDGSINKDGIKEARRGIAKQREKDQQEELQKILGGEQLGLYEKKRIEMCLEKGASNWLSALPLKEAGFSLNKLEFRDAIALRYHLAYQSQGCQTFVPVRMNSPATMR